MAFALLPASYSARARSAATSTPAEVFAEVGACGWATLVADDADEPDNATTAADPAAIAA